MYVNAKDELIALDPFAMAEMECLDVTGMQLVYHTRFSAPDTPSRERSNFYRSRSRCSYHNTVRSFGARVFLLGLRQFYSVSILSWDERKASFSFRVA